jgi:hypothetical protein
MSYYRALSTPVPMQAPRSWLRPHGAPSAASGLCKTLLAVTAGWIAGRRDAAELEIDQIILRHDHSELWARQGCLRNGPCIYDLDLHWPTCVRVETNEFSSCFPDFETFSFRVRYWRRSILARHPGMCPDPSGLMRELNARLLSDVTEGTEPPDDGAKVFVRIGVRGMKIWSGRHWTLHSVPPWWSNFRKRISLWTGTTHISFSGTVRWPSGHRRMQIAREREVFAEPIA